MYADTIYLMQNACSVHEKLYLVNWVLHFIFRYQSQASTMCLSSFVGKRLKQFLKFGWRSKKRLQQKNQTKLYKTFKKILNFLRLDSYIEWKSSNNTYLNIIEIFFFQLEDYQIGKFSNNIDLRKQDFLSEEK